MLRFAIGVTKKDKIRNEYIRDTVKVEWLGMKMRESRLRWTCYVERPEVCKKKGDGNVVTWKSGRPKRRFLDVVKEDMGKLVQGRRTLKIGHCGGTSHTVATPDYRKRPKEGEYKSI